MKLTIIMSNLEHFLSFLLIHFDILTVLKCRQLNHFIRNLIKSAHFKTQWEVYHNYPLNHLTLLLLLNPDELWDYDGLTRNPNITWDIVQRNLDKKWNYYWLSSNKFTSNFSL